MCSGRIGEAGSGSPVAARIAAATAGTALHSGGSPAPFHPKGSRGSGTSTYSETTSGASTIVGTT